MRTQSKESGFPTKITVQTVEVILSETDLFMLLGGLPLTCIHSDKTSTVEFHIEVKKDPGVIK